ncbi:MAG: cell envelope integrity protein TolA [Ramlibacter sp.]
MHAAAERSEFEPPSQPGFLRSATLAVLAHAALVAMLASGLQWKRETQEVAAEAELWSSVPQAAAPKEVTPPPPPPAPAPPPPPPVPAPPPPPAPPAVRAPEPPQQRDADIAEEQEKKRKAAEAARQEAAERERERREKLAQEKLAQKREQERREKLAQQKREAEEKRQEEKRQLAEARRKEEAAKKRKEEQDQRRVAQLREENLRRIQGMAGATGAPTATGNATQSSGPSASWAGRVRARVKPNIVFSDDVAGNPKAEIEVRLAPDGTIVGKRVVRSSGMRAWDDAVLRALDKTETLPRDTDGRVPSTVILEFRPKD